MSNLVNETRLNYYTRQFWDKIKRDLTNGTFVNAQILPNGTTLQFTKKDGTTHNVDLSDFLRRNELTQNGGTNQQANMIPQLGADGKIHISMLPNIPFNNLHVVGTKNDIENMINVGTATAGDMFFVRDTNKVFIFANDQAPAFDDKIIEVGDKDGYVKTVNTKQPSPDGNVNVISSDIGFTDNIQLGALNVQDAIERLNDRIANPTGGTVTKVNGQDPNLQGEVTVKSEHIEYVDNKQLNANTVQKAIDNLVDKIPTDIVNNVGYNNDKTLTVTKNGVPTPIDLSPLVGIKTINRLAGDPDGNIEVSLRKDVDDLYLTVGGQDFGTVTLDYLKDADTTDVGGNIHANKIVKLGADGKLHQTMIPEIAISRVLTAADKQAAINLIGDTDAHLQTGDVVVLTGEKNAVYMFNGTTPAGVDTFADGFIQLHLGDGTVKTVNKIQPDGTGNVELTTAPVFDDTSMKLNTNGSNVEFTSVECYTDQDATALIATFI